MALSAEAVLGNIKTDLQTNLGGFRKAANENNISLFKIVKDLARNFASQKKEISDLHKSINKNVQESKKSSVVLDQISNILKESLNLQSIMIGELKSISIGLRRIGGNTGSYDGNIMGASPFTSNIQSIGLGAAAGMAGAAVGSSIGGGLSSLYDWGKKLLTGGGENENNGILPPQKSGAGGKYNAAAAAQLIRQVGGTPDEAAILGAISQPESSGDPTKYNFKGRDKSYGLWQINMLGAMGPERMKLFGLSSEADLYDPVVNAKAALKLYRMRGNAADWSTYNDGKYKTYYDAAYKAAYGNIPAASTGATPVTPVTPSSAPEQTSSNKPEMASPVSVSTVGGGSLGFGMSGVSSTDTKTPAAEGRVSMTPEMASKENFPHNDIIGLGKALQNQGLRISEHPSFGGVKPVHKGRAHYEGRAIDINAGTGVQEASSSVWGPKFDKLADQLTAAGYKVFWRESGKYGAKGHNNHLHAEISTGGKPSKGDYEGYAGAQGPTMAEASAPTATPVATSPMTNASLKPNEMATMMSMMGGMGSIGGIIGGLGSLISSAQAAEAMPIEAPKPEVPQLSENASIVQQTAISNESLTLPMQPVTSGVNAGAPNVSVNPNSMNNQQPGYAYNMPGDISWPDWASMIGGNHWDALNKIKNHM